APPGHTSLCPGHPATPPPGRGHRITPYRTPARPRPAPVTAGRIDRPVAATILRGEAQYRIPITPRRKNHAPSSHAGRRPVRDRHHQRLRHHPPAERSAYRLERLPERHVHRQPH